MLADIIFDSFEYITILYEDLIWRYYWKKVGQLDIF